MDSAAWGEIALLAACVVVSGFASATETALTSVGRLRVRHLAEEGSRAAAILQQAYEILVLAEKLGRIVHEKQRPPFRNEDGSD